MDHPANCVDVRIAIPEIGLNPHRLGRFDMIRIVTGGDQLDGKAAMPETWVVAGADRIESRGCATILAHRHLSADQQIATPTGVRDVIIIDGRNDVGAHFQRDQETYIAPLDAVPAE